MKIPLTLACALLLMLAVPETSASPPEATVVTDAALDALWREGIVRSTGSADSASLSTALDATLRELRGTGGTGATVPVADMRRELHGVVLAAATASGMSSGRRAVLSVALRSHLSARLQALDLAPDGPAPPADEVWQLPARLRGELLEALSAGVAESSR